MAACELVFLGDIILDVPDPDHWLSGIAPVTHAADVAIGHLEVPHTRRGRELVGDVPAPGADPEHLAALARAGIDAVSMAGNHIADCGPEGIIDTNAEFDRLGIAHTGADISLGAALRPAIVRCKGRNIGLLSFNCVGPEISWATDRRAGCAYVRVEPPDGGPITPKVELTDVEPESLARMQHEIAAARSSADLIVVSLHKGITHRPAVLAPYERPIAHAAIEAGADIVVGHHAHIVRGIEFHRGKPIFHGLGNGVVVTHALSPGQSHAARAEWVERRKKLFGFEPDPAYTLAPFHPEAVNGMIGRVRWTEDGSLETGFIPVWVEPPGRPTLAAGARAHQVAEYIDAITAHAGLPPLQRRERDDWVVPVWQLVNRS